MARLKAEQPDRRQQTYTVYRHPYICIAFMYTDMCYVRSSPCIWLSHLTFLLLYAIEHRTPKVIEAPEDLTMFVKYYLTVSGMQGPRVLNIHFFHPQMK